MVATMGTVKEALGSCSMVKVTFLTPDVAAFGDYLEFCPRAPKSPDEGNEPALIVYKQHAGILEKLRRNFTCRNFSATIDAAGEKPRVTFYFCKGRKKTRRKWYEFFSTCIGQSPSGLFDVEIFISLEKAEVRFYCKPARITSGTVQ
jgi:hypothetical protein